MQLNLKKPLVFFDLETTGVNIVHDRIVEISILKIFPDGREKVKTRLINPEMPIPEESTKIHGITDEDVKDCPTFAQIAKSLSSLLEGCDLAGFNSSRFDIPILAEEFLRSDIQFSIENRQVVDIQTIFHKKEPRTLAAAYQFYCDKTLDDAHSAEADARATYEVFKAQLSHYPDLDNDIPSLSKEYSGLYDNIDFAGRFVYNEEGVECFNFGKYKGQAVMDVLKDNPGYYSWMMDSDFPLNTKQVLTKIRLKMVDL